MEATERLIERLAADAKPVRRLAPPLHRAMAWLLAVGVASAVAIGAFANLDLCAERLSDPRCALEVAATLLTGIAAVIAAYHLCLPDRPVGWALLPLPFVGLWLASSSYGCWAHWTSAGSVGGEWGESAHCFVFILGASVPLGVTLFLLLYRAVPLAPLRVALMGGLGVAGIAAFLLQFFHPFDVTFLDLGVHLAAITLVIFAASITARVRA